MLLKPVFIALGLMIAVPQAVEAGECSWLLQKWLTVKPWLGTPSLSDGDEAFTVRLIGNPRGRNVLGIGESLLSIARQSSRVLEAMGLPLLGPIDFVVAFDYGLVRQGEAGLLLDSSGVGEVSIRKWHFLRWNIGSRNSGRFTITFPEPSELIPFVIAHEIGHVAGDDQQSSFAWGEARADFIAYLLSRETGFNFGMGDQRSVTAPEVARPFELIARTRAYHANSQVMSNLLFKVSEHLTVDHALDLLKFIDRSEFPIPDVFETGDRQHALWLERSQGKSTSFWSGQYILVSPGNQIQARDAWMDVYNAFGQNVRLWAQRTADERVLRTVDHFLDELEN